MGMKILITGSNGFIGRALVQHLISRGHEVYGLNRHLQLSHTKHDFVCDVRDLEALKEVVRTRHWDAIVHSAAIIDISDGKPNDQLGHNIDMTATNTIGTHNLLNASQGNAACLIYLSSMGVIGKPKELPITERHPANGQGLYYSSKLLGEQIVALPYFTEGQGQITLRLAPPIGPGMDGSKILPTFIRNALANEPLIVKGFGNRQQDYIDVRDIAHAVEKAIYKRHTADRIFNIASGRTISNLALAQTCIQHLGSKSTILFKDVDPQEHLVWDISIDKARRSLGFAPIYEIEHTIDSIVEAIRA